MLLYLRDEFSWISEWAMNPHNKQASQPINNQQSDNKFPTKNNDSKVSEKNKSSNTEEEKSSKISDLKTSTEGVTSPHDEETSHAVNQYGRPMCVALNIENQFRWDTR